MKPITVDVKLDRPRERVYDFLAVLGNHEAFTNHLLVDWELSGPAAGVGAAARMRAAVPGPRDYADMRVTEVEPPRRIVEEAVGAGGSRRTRGTYTLEDAPDGGTFVRFELETLAAPLPERVLAPLVRAFLQRANAKAMRRLREQQDRIGPTATGRPAPV
jgi:uncharacterized protein YndB with AHSA1/START domain